MPLLKTLLRNLSLLFSLWLLWASAVISQNVTHTLDTPFTINFGNTTIATLSSTTHKDRGWSPKGFLGGEPAVFILKDGILSSGHYSLGNGPQDNSLGPKNVYWVTNDGKNRPRLDLRERHSVFTDKSQSLVLLYGGRPTMYAHGADGQVLRDISPKGWYREGPEPGAISRIDGALLNYHHYYAMTTF
ncbi:hypothetical protein B0T11DRAFT_302667 [Plectosphaerella cucumerina]|uniref:Uncharacterized protein n=1 Tax=Plectosphaerella cucumerina TaxID=40658 RepID=A0A8K0T790_9PEZI|nr:hypothetical protein B0T11DRAFT_302667 [Plectosphaerella cucumerina]